MMMTDFRTPISLRTPNSSRGRIAGAAVLLVLFTGLAACSDLAPDPDRDPRVQLERAQELWQEAGYDTYEYRLEWECQCPAQSQQPIWVVIKEGTIHSARTVSGNDPVPINQSSVFLAVEGIFGIVEEAIIRQASRIDVNYDNVLGYPRWIDIQYSSQGGVQEWYRIGADGLEEWTDPDDDES
jgi:hypothetical protein